MKAGQHICGSSAEYSAEAAPIDHCMDVKPDVTELGYDGAILQWTDPDDIKHTALKVSIKLIDEGIGQN